MSRSYEREKRERHAQILTRIWDDADWKARSPRAQWMYLLLLSQASLNRAGVLDLTIKRWSSMARNAGNEMVLSAMAELEQAKFIVVDHDTEELLVRSYMRNDGVAKQPNVLKAALRQAQEVHSGRLRAALAKELRRLGKPEADEVARSLVKANAKGSDNPSDDDPGGKRESPRSETLREGFAEGFGEPLAYPRGVGVGVGSPSSVGTNSRSQPSSSKIAAQSRPDVDQLCERLRDRILANGAKATITAKWRDDARLLLDRDQRDLDEALELVDWATSHEFWRSNVLSMPTFRKKYDQLRLQSSRPHLRAVSGGHVPFRNPIDLSVYQESLLP